MKNKINIAFFIILLSIIGCQTPADLTPSISREGINSLTASFDDDDSPENEFKAEIDHENRTINMVFPYNYPKESNTVLLASELTKMRVSANLDDNVYLAPGLLYMDFSGTVENSITIIDQKKENIQYKITSEIRKRKKVGAGLRAGSGKLLWAKKLQADVGIVPLQVTGGIAVTKDYVVLNTRGIKSKYLDAKTGEVVGEIDLGANMGGLINFYTTADSDGNIFHCNLSPNAPGDFKIWMTKDVNTVPTEYISYPHGGLQMGRKISISGSVDKDAIITAPIHNNTGKFLRWQVIGGNLVSQTPDIITLIGVEKWGNNGDIMYTNPTDISSDYVIACYGIPRHIVHTIDGKTNALKISAPVLGPNWVPGSVDYTVFNKVPYIISNSIDPWGWGGDPGADAIWLYDYSSFSFSKRIHVCDDRIYGGYASNGNYTGDVAFKLSSNGFYMYVYFMFTNGYVVCYQYDCIDM